METPRQPVDEIRRLQALQHYNVLDTPPEQALDDLVALAARTCDAPIALISLVDERRQWFKSRIGLALCETARDISFCGHTILRSDLFIVSDAARDVRFTDNPLVTDDPRIRFYAGAPLLSPEGQALGALCVMDHVPRELTESQQEALRILSRQVISLLELRRQTRELAQSEERLRIVTDNARVGLVIVDRDRRYVYANSAYGDVLGLASSAIVGRRVPDVLPGLYEEQIRPRLDRAFAGQRVAYELHKPAGDRSLYYAVRYEPTEPGRASPLVVVVITDVTERKLAEMVSNRLAAIVESSDDAIIGKDLTGIVTSWNRGAEKIFGYASAEMVGRSIMQLIPADRHDEENHILGKIKLGESVEHFETLRKTSDARLINVSVTISPIKDTAGTVIGVSKVLRDITERKRAEANLRASEARLNFALETSQTGAWELSLEDHTANRTLIHDRIFGYQALLPEWTLELFLDHVLPMDRARVSESCREAMAAGVNWSFECRIRRADGDVRWIWAAGGHERNAEGVAVRISGIVQDVTERKQAEVALRELEEQFRQAQKMEAIGQLAGGVAHDFNNILAVIVGNADLALTDAPQGHPARESLEEIKKASGRATSLVQQILAFSRQQSLERRVITLGPLVLETANFLRATIPAIVEVATSVDKTAPPVLADPTQIHQILVNLCTNSWHALEDQAGRIEIKLESVTLDAELASRLEGLRPGRFVCLSVSDTGAGMDAATLARIFNPFFTTKEPGKGTGLGLSVVHGIVQEHDGAVSVTSQPGKGATFRVYFPAANAPEDRATSPAPVPPMGQGQRILYLDDEEPLVQVAKRMLERLGYHVSGFTRAADALNAFREHPDRFDLIVTDLNMPGSSGLGVASDMLRLRADVPVVLSSGHVTEDLRDQARAVGIREVLYKPSTIAEMSQTIHCLTSPPREP